jgi:hypothetical protein
MEFGFQLTRKDTGAVEELRGDISAEDWVLFTEFRDYSGEIRNAEWFRAGLDAGFSLKYKQETGLSVEVPNQPSNAAVRELLHLLRPFVLQKERKAYVRVASKLWQYFDHPYLRQVLAKSRKIFDDGQFSLYGHIELNDLRLNDDRTFGLWLNAFEYHRDPAKRAELEKAFHGQPDDLVMAIFRGMISDKAVEVLRLAAFITGIEDAHNKRVQR